MSRSPAASPDKGLTPDNVIPISAQSAPGTRSGSDREPSPTIPGAVPVRSTHDVRDGDRHCGLADPAWTDNREEPAPDQLLRQPRDDTVAADDAREQCRQIAGLGHPGRRGGCRQRVLARHRCDKGVTSAREVGDVALAGAAIAERFAQRRNMDPEGGLFDDRVRPSPGDQLLFRDRLAGALDERNQNIERTAPEAQRFPVLEEHALSRDQPERSEGEDFFIHRAIVLRASRNSYRPWRIFASPPRQRAQAPARSEAAPANRCKDAFAQLCNR